MSDVNGAADDTGSVQSIIDIDLDFADRTERDRQYNARDSVPDFDACVREYAHRAAQVRRDHVGLFDIHYGPGRDQRLDIFPVTKRHQPAPVFVFIHGGYWRAQSKADAPIMVPAMTQAGVAVVTLEYTLLPESTLSETVGEMRSAIAWLHRHASHYGIDPERIVVSGSSAGGHLAAMLAADGWQDRYQLPADVIKGMVALSGLFDLRPLCDTHINEWLRLHPEQARLLSPMFQLPPSAFPVVLAVGGLETDGFKNQTEAYRHACDRAGVDVSMAAAPQCNHFDLVHELCQPTSDLLKKTFDLMRLAMS